MMTRNSQEICLTVACIVSQMIGKDLKYIIYCVRIVLGYVIAHFKNISSAFIFFPQ